MPLQISINDRKLSQALTSMTRLLRNMQPVYEAIGSALERNVELRFDTKSDPNGQAWKAWAPSTAAARKREGRGTLLEYTGRMRSSLTHLASNRAAVVGFGVPYAKYHEASRPMLTVNGALGRDDQQDALDAAMRSFSRNLRLQVP